MSCETHPPPALRVTCDDQLIETSPLSSLEDALSTSCQINCTYPNVFAQDRSRVHLGDVHYHYIIPGSMEASAEVEEFGPCLGKAPQIPPHAFKGRDEEIDLLHRKLTYGSAPARQNIVSLVGMGGVGKTQLSLAYARRYSEEYSSVFWVNAKDETTIRQDLVAMRNIIAEPTGFSPVSLDESQCVCQVRQWLSRGGNHRWLLVLDNYDDPDLPGIRSTSGYDIRSYFPYRSQGSILITTRSSKLTFSTQVHIRPLVNVSTSVEILSERSGRELSTDPEATVLADRLAGLPLALATAGSYLSSVDISCGEYQDLYETTWTDLVGSGSEFLLDYEQRTLASTWNVSLGLVSNLNANAASLVALFAFLSPRNIWFELIEAGEDFKMPWASEIIHNKLHLQRAMSTLHAYSFVDKVADSYQLHQCVHDWLAAKYITPQNLNLFTIAVTCVGNTIHQTLCHVKSWTQLRKVLEHSEYLCSEVFDAFWIEKICETDVACAADQICNLLGEFNHLTGAQSMLEKLLRWKEETLGRHNISTFWTLRHLADTLRSRGLVEEAESHALRAFTEISIAFGKKHQLALLVAAELGSIYRQQGRFREAESLMARAMVGMTSTLGPMHYFTLNTAVLLADVCRYTDKVKTAEDLFLQTLHKHTQVFPHRHCLPLSCIRSLAVIYETQGQAGKAQELYARAIAKYRSIMEDTTTCSAREHSEYAEILVLCVRRGHVDGEAAVSARLSLIHMVGMFGQFEPTIIGCLGKALLFMRDDVNGRIAYRLSVQNLSRLGHDDALYYGVFMCDGCNKGISSTSQRNICQSCPDTDLCDSCVSEHQSGRLTVSSCVGHDFFRLDRTSLLRPEDENFNVDEWLKELKRKYS